MDFDIIIPTRNRSSVLKLSIPLMLSQERLPKSIIIIDSSDNHSDVVKVVEETVNITNTKVNLEILRSNAGSSYQRNVGMKYAKSQIVMFPDDDSLWFPKVASSIMRIYEKDTEGAVGAVGASYSLVPPTGVFEDSKYSHGMTLRDRLQLIRFRLNLINRVENWLFPDPFIYEGLERLKVKKLPTWFGEENVKVDPSMTGLTMTFPTDLAKKIKFDEALGRYALFEDRDVSLGVLRDHLILEAKDAKVFHYRSPEQRVPGDEWGVMSILNMAYIICKHTPPNSTPRELLRRHCFYRGIRYILQVQTNYGRRRAVGAWKALLKLSKILNSPQEEVMHNYICLRERCLRNI